MLPSGIIVVADDLGIDESVNDAVWQAMSEGVCSSASLMVLAPAARGAARDGAGADIGVHLTVCCERPGEVWEPLTGGESLRGPGGGLWGGVEAVWERVRPEEAYEEMCAQVECALAWGVDVTHVDAHMYAVQLSAPLCEAYLTVAARYSLPARLVGGTGSWARWVRGRAAELGVVGAEHLLDVVDTRDPEELAALRRKLAGTGEGVCEVWFHPGLGTTAARRWAGWERREADLVALCAGGAVAEAVEGRTVLGWAAVRDAWRAAMEDLAQRAGAD